MTKTSRLGFILGTATAAALAGVVFAVTVRAARPVRRRWG
jgi:hypothetical protein